MRVSIEPAEGWAPARVMARQLDLLGYLYVEYIVLGRRVFKITG